ncbi:Twin-arginine translocation protein TatB [Bathymodiolus heckerae thiotrophic gill symbiont]|uniref:Sec-independent protein translocase protein TatB n=1 Tax=Bathymodiolus heckerae thiotrophic gill symbiont TaxID=1052212 RepID=UPI0010BC5036|nr:Sec-independent protein translocase protein TatB [Bathymodiolus heckerae thiotrophic gill symbiont]SHN89866.1 Twin-arginine translocation protein TatB [Bathymodiolus heckerae thiotrophic gill symbiont]
MFDVGFWEFALIGVIALIIVGPERMPSIARSAGRYAGKAKRFIAKIQDDVSEELDVEKFKDQLSAMDKDSNIIEILDETKDTINDIKNDVNSDKT